MTAKRTIISPDSKSLQTPAGLSMDIRFLCVAVSSAAPSVVALGPVVTVPVRVLHRPTEVDANLNLLISPARGHPFLRHAHETLYNLISGHSRLPHSPNQLTSIARL